MKDTVYCVLCTLATLMLGILGARYLTDNWLLAFVESLQLHFSLALIPIVLLALAVKRHWFGFALLALTMALAGHSIMMLQQYAVAPAVAGNGPALRLLSFNIDRDNDGNGGRIADAILGAQADVAIVEEAFPLLPELPRLSAVYPYRVGCGVAMEGCDTLVMSKRSFQTQDVRSLSDLWKNRFIAVGIDIGGTPLNIVVAHLSKPYFDQFHAGELGYLGQYVNEIKGPLVLAGDFNAAVMAPDMRNVLRTSGLRHLFPEPATWPIAAGGFGISIDHVFARAPAELISVRRLPDNIGSNHYGLLTEFTIGK